MDETAAFFQRLADVHHAPLLEPVTGTVQFEIVDGAQVEAWTVAIDHGDVAVTQAHAQEPDCEVLAPRALFNRVLRGETNAMAQVLRGAIQGSGDLQLLMLVQRIFPGPPSPRVPAAGAVPQ
jgi:putative sterol carrier protein